MPIKSYLVFPQQGQTDRLEQILSKISGCEVIQAENKELLILVSDTASKQEEEQLLNKLQNIKSLHHLNLVAGFDD